MTEPKLPKSNDRIPRDEMVLAKVLADRELANQKFQTMSPAEKRVALAKDVLLQIDLDIMEPSKGVYAVAAIDGVPSHADEPFDSCQVCALGALWMAHTMPETARACVLGSEDMATALSDVFPYAQLRLIECAFERWDAAGSWWNTRGYGDMANYGAGLDDRGRMVLIMKNIIRNEGEFYPEQDL